MPVWNEAVGGLACMRCGAMYAVGEVGDNGLGCPKCLAEGYPSSVYLTYGDVPLQPDATKSGMARYSSHLPYTEFTTLGEGMTPVVQLEADDMQLWLKNEGQNPTGSHKDRMSALAVARAQQLGRDTVVAASSGNAGSSLAAYAAAAGLRCVIISNDNIRPAWARAIQITGAELHITQTAKGRWEYMRHQVENEGWYIITNFLTPPVGSNPYGNQGYKTVAYELAEQLPEPPTVVIVPCSRGDLLWGIWQGFREMNMHPRMVSVEPIPRLERVVAGEDYRMTFEGVPGQLMSIAGSTATYQSVLSVTESKGTAVTIPEAAARKAQPELAHRGIYAEMSSVTSYAAWQQLKEVGQITPDDRAVILCTSHGYKDLPEQHRSGLTMIEDF